MPASWIETATAFHIATGTSARSDWSQGYGYQFWRCQGTAFRGDGAFGQYTIVLPEQDAVIVMTSENKNMQGQLDLVWKHLLPAMDAKAPQAADLSRLKTLKLTGMLDTLDARLAQTRDGKLGHLEFLQVLCEDEIARRDTAALARRVRRARFEQHATFEDFDFTVSPKLPAAMLRDLSALRWLEAGESVILYGPVGVGKTHVAQALGHQVARRGGDIRFVKCSRMLADLAGGHADRTIGQRMREYTRPLVLIVDDFAMREHTPTQSDDLYDLVSDRAIAAKPLILTSNRAPKDWYPLFPNPVVAESLLDRLINTSHQVLMDGPSYRPRKRPGTKTT